MYKKIILAFILLFIAMPVSANIQATATNKITTEKKEALTQKQETATAKLDENYDTLKDALIKKIDKAIAMIDDTISKISSNNQISAVSKEAIITSLNNAKKQLETYKAQVEKTSTLAELQKVNQEVVKYLQTNKDLIKKNIQNTIVIIGEEATKKAEEYKKKLMLTLEILEKTCPAEKTTIQNLEAKLTELDKEIQALKTATKNKNTSEIKKLTKEITTTVTEIATLMESLEGKCQF